MGLPSAAVGLNQEAGIDQDVEVARRAGAEIEAVGHAATAWAGAGTLAATMASAVSGETLFPISLTMTSCVGFPFFPIARLMSYPRANRPNCARSNSKGFNIRMPRSARR